MSSEPRKAYRKKSLFLFVAAIAVFMTFSASVYAWYSISRAEIASYIPVASPQSLYLGAGHVEIVNGVIEEYEDVRICIFPKLTSPTNYHIGIICSAYAEDQYRHSKFNLPIRQTTNSHMRFIRLQSFPHRRDMSTRIT